MMYAPGVLWTAAHHRIPMLTIMHNNRAYHQEKNVVYSMSARAVTDVFVEGEAVVRNRCLARIELATVQDRVRTLTQEWRRES